MQTKTEIVTNTETEKETDAYTHPFTSTFYKYKDKDVFNHVT